MPVVKEASGEGRSWKWTEVWWCWVRAPFIFFFPPVTACSRAALSLYISALLPVFWRAECRSETMLENFRMTLPLFVGARFFFFTVVQNLSSLVCFLCTGRFFFFLVISLLTVLCCFCARLLLSFSMVWKYVGSMVFFFPWRAVLSSRVLFAFDCLSLNCAALQCHCLTSWWNSVVKRLMIFYIHLPAIRLCLDLQTIFFHPTFFFPLIFFLDLWPPCLFKTSFEGVIAWHSHVTADVMWQRPRTMLEIWAHLRPSSSPEQADVFVGLALSVPEFQPAVWMWLLLVYGVQLRREGALTPDWVTSYFMLCSQHWKEFVEKSTLRLVVLVLSEHLREPHSMVLSFASGCLIYKRCVVKLALCLYLALGLGL